MTQNKDYIDVEQEVKEIAEYLGCNADELWSEMSKLIDKEHIDLSKEVMQGLIPYLYTGCTLETVIEDFEGEKVKRWIVNNEVIIWSEQAQLNGDKK